MSDEDDSPLARLNRRQDQLDKSSQKRRERLARMQDEADRALYGPSAVEKHIMLLKLVELAESPPQLGQAQPTPEQRQWFSRVGAVFSQLKDLMWHVKFDSSVGTMGPYPQAASNQIIGYAYDVIEILKLELELDGRSEIGTAYPPGETYRYFADVKQIISNAEDQIFLVDPYFNGEIFDSYFGEVAQSIKVHLLVDRYVNDLKGYVERHVAQYGSRIELRANKHELHDRLLFIDGETCWFTGGSFKEAGHKASYLVPFGTEISADKLAIYRDIWNRSNDKLATP